MNFLSIISVLLLLVYLQLGVFIFLKDRHSSLNQYFFALSICFTIWSFGYIFVYSAKTPDNAHFWDGIASLGYCTFPAFMFAYKYELCKFAKNIKFYSIFFSLLGIGLFLSLSIILGYWEFTIIEGKYSYHFIHDLKNIYYLMFYIYIAITTILVLYYIYLWKKKIKTKNELHQFNIVLFSLIIFMIFGFIIDLVLPSAFLYPDIPNIGHITSLPWIFGISYAIIRFKLMQKNNYLIAQKVFDELQQIAIFTDLSYNVIYTNSYTKNLLFRNSNSNTSKSVFQFFGNENILKYYFKESVENSFFGPVNFDLFDANDSQIKAQLIFISLKDNFDDVQGYIIYGLNTTELHSLEEEVKFRKEEEKRLHSISKALENRLQTRTNKLTSSHQEFQEKIAERMRIEEQFKTDITEKEILTNEIHDRVKNNMNILISLIKSYDKSNLKPKISKKLKQLIFRVKSLLMVHQNLYLSITYSDVDFSFFIKKITTQLIDFYQKTGKVEIRYDLSDVFLDVDLAIPMGIVANELISNSLEHGFSNHHLRQKNNLEKNIIYIKYQFQDEKYEFSISHNGKKLPKNFDLNELQTNGLPLTDILVKDQVNGKMEFKSYKENTMFKITFSVQKPRRVHVSE